MPPTGGFLYKKMVFEILGNEYTSRELIAADQSGYFFHVKKEGKDYMAKALEIRMPEDQLERDVEGYKMLQKCGIPGPKILQIDPQTKMILFEFSTIRTVYELLVEKEETTSYLEEIRRLAEVAKASGIALDYFPSRYLASEGKLIYLSSTYYPYSEEKSLANTNEKYWSQTQELEDYIKNRLRFVSIP